LEWIIALVVIFLNAGIGYGGFVFPKDIAAFSQSANGSVFVNLLKKCNELTSPSKSVF